MLSQFGLCRSNIFGYFEGAQTMYLRVVSFPSRGVSFMLPCWVGWYLKAQRWKEITELSVERVINAWACDFGYPTWQQNCDFFSGKHSTWSVGKHLLSGFPDEQHISSPWQKYITSLSLAQTSKLTLIYANRFSEKIIGKTRSFSQSFLAVVLSRYFMTWYKQACRNDNENNDS